MNLRLPKPQRRARKPKRRPAMFRKRASIGELRKLADDLMSLYVRHEAGWVCWVCGSGRHHEMQMAHLFPKGAHPGGRYRLENVRCCCYRCHAYYTHRWEEWRRLLIDRLGRAFDRLSELVDVRERHDYVAEVVYWHRKLRARQDCWKVEERVAKLEARMARFGIEGVR